MKNPPVQPRHLRASCSSLLAMTALAILGMTSQDAKALNFTNTNSANNWISTGLNGAFAPNGALTTPFDATNGVTNAAIFTNKSVQTVNLGGGTVTLNLINNGNGSGNNAWTNTFTNGTMNFAGANATMFDGANSASGSLALYYNSILTSTNLSIGGSTSLGTTYFFNKNVFSNGVIGISTLLGTNTAGNTTSHVLNVAGTNFGGSYIIGYAASGGQVNVNNTGTLNVNASLGGLISNATSITANGGSTIGYLTTNSSGLTSTAFGATTLTLNAATFSYSASGSTNMSASIAGLSLADNVTSFINATSGAAGSNVINLGTLSLGPNTTLQTSLGNANSSVGRVQVDTNGLSLVNGILPWGVDTSGGGFLTYTNVGGTNYLGGYSQLGFTYSNDIIDGTGAADNLKFSSNTTFTLSASQTNNSLTFTPMTGGSTLSLGANTLTVGSGGILLTSSNNGASITGGTLTAGTGGVTNTLYLWNTTTNALTIGSTIADNGSGTVSLIKAGTGSGGVILSGSNSYTGPTLVESGTLTVTNGGYLNSDVNVGTTNIVSPTAVFNNYGTVSNVTVGLANASSATTGNFYNAGTILGKLTIATPVNNYLTWLYAGAVGTLSGVAKLDSGTSVTNVVDGGNLIIAGTNSMTVNNVTGVTNPIKLPGSVFSTTLVGGFNGVGVITVTSSYTNGGAGNTISFSTNRNDFSAFLLSTNSFVTLSQSGSSTTSFMSFGYTPGNTIFNTNSAVTLSGGTWLLGYIGQGNSAGFNEATNTITNAVVNVSSNYANASGVWNINNGALNFTNSTTTVVDGQSSPSNNFNMAFYVNGGGTLTVAGGLTLGQKSATNTPAGNVSSYPSALIVNGGTATVGNGGSSALTLGQVNLVSTGFAGTTNDASTVTVTNNGRLSINGNLTLAGSTNGVVLNQTNTVNLSIGNLTVTGTIGTGTSTSVKNSFNWTGGTLSVGTVSATNATWNGSSSSISNNTLYNTGGNLDIGNTNNGFAGKTVVTGNYVQSGNGTATFHINGITAATNYTGGTTNYDTLVVSSNAVIGGNLSLLPSFTPTSNGVTLNIVTATSAFTNTGITLVGANIYTNGGNSVQEAYSTDGYSYFTLATTATNLQAVSAFNYYTNGSGVWDATTTNWSGGVSPNATNLTAFFGSNGGGGTVTLTSNQTVGSLILSNSTNGYTLAQGGGGTITLNAGVSNAVVINNAAGTNIINADIALSNNAVIKGGGALTLGGGISGAFALNDSNTGIVTIAGSNAYTGGTILNASTLVAANTSAFGPAGSSVTLNGGVLDLHTDTNLAGYNFVVNSNAVIRVDRATAGAPGITNNVGNLSIGASTLTVVPDLHNATTNSAYGLTFGSATLTGNATFDVANNGTGTGNLTLGAVSGGSNSLTKQNAGVLTLSGSNSYTGGTIINGGTVNVTGTVGAVTVNSGGTLAGTNTAGDVTLNTGGTMTSSGSSATSGTTLSLSSLIMNGGSTYLWNFYGAVNDLISVGGGVSFGTNSPINITVTTNSSTTWDASTSTNFVILTAGSFTNFSASGFHVNQNIGNGSWSVLDATNQLILSYTVNNSAIVVNADAGVTTNQLTDTNIAFTGLNTPLLKTGAGEYVLDNSSNSYGSATFIGAGTLTAATNSAFGNTTDINIGTGTNGLPTGSNAALNINTAGITVPNAISAHGSATNTIANTSAGTVTYSGPVAAQTNVTLTTTLSSGNTLFTGQVTGSGLVTISGAGTLTLAGANNYTGGTILNGGVLVASNTAAFGAPGASLALNGGNLDIYTDTSINAYNVTVTTNAVIELDRVSPGAGITNTFGTLSMGAGTISVTPGIHNLNADTAYGLTFGAVTMGGNATFDITNNGAGIGNLTLGAISGNFGLTKLDNGNLTLAGSNSYTGGTTVNGGSVILANSNALTSSTDLLLSNGSLLNLNANSASVLSLNGSTDTAITNGGSSASLTISGAGSSAYTGTLAGAINLIQSGSGTLVLTGSNSYSSGTTVNGGLLQLGNVYALGSTNGGLNNNGIVELNGNSIQIGALNGSATNATLQNNPTNSASVTLTLGNSNASGSYAGIIMDNASNLSSLSLVKTGNGSQTLAGANTYSGTTLVQGGALILTNNGSLANSALTITNVGYTGIGFTNATASTTLTLSSAAGLSVGQFINGNGIPTGATITAISGNTVTISTNTTAANASTVFGNAYTSVGAVNANSGTLTNVNVGGNASATINTVNNGSAGTANFTASNAVINGTMTINGPSTGVAFLFNNSVASSLGTNYGYAVLGSGVTVTNLVVGGRLDISGSGSLSINNISGVINGQSAYAGGGSGAIQNNSTYSAANAVSGFGNVLNFTAGSAFAGYQMGAASFATFTQSGAGSVTFGYYQGSYNGIASTAQNATNTFSGGTWYLGQIGQGNSGQQAGEVNVLASGASVTVGTNTTQAGGTWVITNGVMTFNGNNGASSSMNGAGQTFGIVVGPSGVLNTLGTLAIGIKGGSATVTNTTAFLTNNGGIINSVGSYTLGMIGTASNGTTNFANMTLNAGTTSISNNLTLGSANSNITNSENNTLTLAGGTLVVTATLGAGTGTSDINSFVWSGGTLSAGTINTTNSTWNGVNSSISNSTLYNTAGTLDIGNTAPAFAGKTAITGNYLQTNTGTTAFHIYGTNAPTTWAGGSSNYDLLAVSGTANFAGGTVSLYPSFVPTSNVSLNILTSTNLSFGATLAGANVYNSKAFNSDGLTYFTLSNNATTLSAVYTTNNFNQWQGGSGVWDETTTNWTGGVNPNATNLSAYFGDAGGAGTVTLATNRTVGSLILSNTSTGYTLANGGSSTLTLNAGSGNTAILNNAAGANAVNPDIVLAGNLNLLGTGTLSLGGNISGAFALNDSNTGTVNLTGSNSYSGGTLISTGILGFGNDSSLGSGVVTNNATLAYIGAGASVLNNTVAGSGSLSVAGTGTLTLSGAQTFASATVSSGGLVLTNNMLSSTPFIVNGGNLGLTGSAVAGNVTLNSGLVTNDGTIGTIAVGGGTLAVSPTGSLETLNLNGGSAVINGTATNVTASGGTLGGIGNAGNVTLNSGATITSGGATGLTSGTLSVSSLIINGGSAYTWNLQTATNGSSAYDLINSTGSVTLNNSQGNKFTINVATNGTTSWDQSVSTNFVILTGSSLIGYDPAAINISTTVSQSAGGTWTISNSVSSLVLVYTANAPTISVYAGDGLTVVQSIATNTVFAGANTPLTKDGAGEYILDMTNTYGSSTTIGAGTLTAANNSSFGISPTIFVGTSTNGGAAATLNINTDGVTISNAITASGNGTNTIENTSAGTVTYSGSVNLSTNATLASVLSSGNTIFSGGIGGPGAATIAGSGTVTLASANTYTGGTVLQSGTLALSNNTALGTGALLVASNATIQTVASITTSNAMQIGSGVTATLDAAGNSYANAGNISGTGGSLMISNSTGSGVVTLSGSNTFDGITSLNSGTLNLAGSNALKNSTLSMNGGSLSFDSSVSANAFTVGGLSAVTNGTGYDITLNNNASAGVTLTVGSTNNLNSSYSGNLSGSGILVKAGTGTLTLGGDNSGLNGGAGGITLQNGTLAVAAGSLNALGGVNANVTFTGALNKTLDLGAQTVTVANVIQSGAGTLNLQNGTLALNDNNFVTSITFGAINEAANASLDSSASGDAIILTNASVLAGSNTTAATGFTLQGSSLTLDNNAALGSALTVTGASTLSSTTGYTNISAGTIDLSTMTSLGVSSGTLDFGSASQYLKTTTNLFTVNAGTLILTNVIGGGAGGASTVGGVTKTGAGTLVLGGGLTVTGGSTTVRGGLLDLLSGTLTNSAVVVTNGAFTEEMAATIGGTTGLSVQSNGVATLNGANSYTGVTAVNAGTLNLNGSLSNSTISVTNSTLTEGPSGSIFGYYGSTGMIISNSTVVLSGSNSIVVTNSITTPGILVNAGGIVSFASSNALTPSVGVCNPGGINYSSNNTRVVVLSVTGGQALFTNSGVTNTLYGGENIATLSNGVATNINVNENILVTGTSNGVTNLIISNGAALVQNAPAGNQGTSLSLNTGAKMFVGNGSSYIGNLINTNTGQANQVQVNTGSTLQVDSGGTFNLTGGTLTNGTISGGALLLGSGTSSRALNLVTNAGTMSIAGNVQIGNGSPGSNEFDQNGTLTVINRLLAGASGAGTNTANFMSNSVTTVGQLFAGSSGTGINNANILGGATVTVTNNVAIGYTGGSSNAITVSAGGMLTIGSSTNSGSILVGQAESNATNTFSNAGSVSATLLAINYQNGSNNVDRVFQGAGTLSVTSLYLSGNNGAAGLSNTALFDVTGGLFTNSGTTSIGYQGTNVLNTIQVDGGTAFLGGVTMGAQSTNAFGSTNSILLNGGTLVANSFAVGSNSVATGATNLITFNGGTLQAGSGAATNFLSNGIATVTLGAAGGTIDSTTNSIEINAGIGGVGNLNFVGAGTLALSGTNSYTGATVINSGTLQIGNGTDAGTIASSPAITNNGSLVYNVGSGNRTNSAAISGTGSLAQSGTGTLTLIGSNSYTGATVINSGTLQIGNGTDAGTIASSLTITNNGVLAYNVSGNRTNSAAISGSGSVAQSGTGTLTLVGNNSYSGATLVNSGALVVGNVNALGSSNAALSVSGILDMAGYSPTVDALSGGVGGVVSNSGSAAILTVGANNGGGTYSGVIQSGIGLTKNGTGTQILTGANTYDGATVINAGTLQIGDGTTDAGTIATSLTITNNGSLVYNVGSGNRTNSAAISGSGSFAQNGTGTLTLAGANTYTGTTAINNAGTLAIAAGSSLASTNVYLGTLAAQGTLDLSDQSGGYIFGTNQSLSGRGRVNLALGRALTINGSLTPGDQAANTPGIITVNGDMVLGDTATTSMQIQVTNPLTGYDRLTISGAMTYGGVLNIVISTNTFTPPTMVDTYQLFTSGTNSAGVNDFTQVKLAGSWSGAFINTGGNWIMSDPNYLWTFSEANGQLSIEAIPEPRDLVLLGGLAMAAVLFYRRRNNCGHDSAA